MGQQRATIIGGEGFEGDKKAKKPDKRAVKKEQKEKKDKYAAKKGAAVATPPAEEKTEAKKISATKPAKIRSKRYQNAKALIEPGKLYELNEALELVKKTATTKFDSTVEAHIQIQKGKKEKPGVAHFSIGKVSLDIIKLAQNYKEAISTLPQNKIQVIHLASSMGPSVKVLTE